MVETYNSIVERSAQVYSTMPKNVLLAPLFYGFLGLIFLIFGLVNEDGFFSFTVLLGAGFILFAVLVFRANRKAYGAHRP